MENFKYGEIDKVYKIGDDVKVWIFQLIEPLYFSTAYMDIYMMYIDGPRSAFMFPETVNEYSRFRLASKYHDNGQDDDDGWFSYDDDIAMTKVKEILSYPLNDTYGENDITEIDCRFLTWNDVPDALRGEMARKEYYGVIDDMLFCDVIWKSNDINERFDLSSYDNECYSMRDFRNGEHFRFDAPSDDAAIDAAIKIADALLAVERQFDTNNKKEGVA